MPELKRAPARSLREVSADARTALRDAGIPDASAALDAELLARHVLGWDRAAWIVGRESEASSDFLAAYEPLVARRVAHEPIAYIQGTREFYGRDFLVSPAVLIPRPETEMVVDAALRLLQDVPAIVADVCTGSGILAVTLACEQPRWRLTATDVSPAAVAMARANAARHRVSDRVTCREGDLLADVEGPLDLIVANPPYVARGTSPTMPREVAEHEPAIALYGGQNGLALIEPLLAQAHARVRTGGWLVMEFGAGQQHAVRRLAERAGWLIDGIPQDLQGHPRVLLARR